MINWGSNAGMGNWGQEGGIFDPGIAPLSPIGAADIQSLDPDTIRIPRTASLGLVARRIPFQIVDRGSWIVDRGSRHESRITNHESRVSTLDEVTKRASEARDADHLDEAVRLYQQAVDMRPSWAEGWWYLGAILYDLDAAAEARNAFHRLVSIEPENGSAWALMGLCEFQLRDYGRGLGAIHRAHTLGLRNQEALASVIRYQAAIVLTRFGQFDASFDVLRALAREQNGHASFIEAMGLNVLRLPLLPSEVPPDQHELVVMAGRAGYDMAARRMQEAGKAFRELIVRYPDAPNVHYAFGVYLLNENSEAALAEFHRELQITPEHVPARLYLALELINCRRFAAGLPFAEQAVQLAPNSFGARTALGHILLEIGDTVRAIKELETGATLAPDRPVAHFALARAYARAGRKEDAARERAAFLRFDAIDRTQRDGPQSVGGVQTNEAVSGQLSAISAGPAQNQR